MSRDKSWLKLAAGANLARAKAGLGRRRQIPVAHDAVETAVSNIPKEPTTEIGDVLGRFEKVANDQAQLRELAYSECKDCNGTGLYGHKLVGKDAEGNPIRVPIVCSCAMQIWAQREALRLQREEQEKLEVQAAPEGDNEPCQQPQPQQQDPPPPQSPPPQPEERR